MLLRKLFPGGKKSFLNAFLNFFYTLLKPKKPLVVLEACAKFHLEHFESVIKKLSASNLVYIIVVAPDHMGMNSLKNVCFYPAMNKYPLYRKASIFISTELHKIPFWFDCPSVYFGHGMGAKLDYVANKSLSEYDFVFSPCRPTYDVQLQVLSKEKVFQIGLPILDDPSVQRQEIIDFFNLDESKPVLVYAPSWCNDISKISDIKLILSYLRKRINYNIVVSPHPSLFIPERCSGEALFSVENELAGAFLNIPGSPFNTLELVKSSEVVVSDISSILFEAMALRKKVIFDGNRELYQYCDALPIYEEVIKICPIVNWQAFDDPTLDNLLVDDELSVRRGVFIDNYLFNNGNASNEFIEAVNKILLFDRPSPTEVHV